MNLVIRSSNIGSYVPQISENKTMARSEFTKTDHQNSVRNVNIEILRIIAMLLVLACHGILHLNWLLDVDRDVKVTPGIGTAASYTVVQYGQVGVCIFFIISGYFLVKKSFSWKRIVIPWTQLLVYTILCFVITLLLPTSIKNFSGISNLFSSQTAMFNTLMSVFTPILSSAYWFMTTYIAMIILAPYVNTLFDQLQESQILGLMAFFAFISILMLYGGRTYLWNNIMYACLCYIIGGWIRIYLPQHKQPKIWHLLATVSLSTLLMFLFNYASASNSTFTHVLHWNNYLHDGIWLGPIIIAACLFILAIKIPSIGSSSFVTRSILALSPATFGVYLLHENLFGYRLLWRAWEHFVQAPHSLNGKVTIFIMIIFITYLGLLLIAYLIDSFIARPISQKIASTVTSK